MVWGLSSQGSKLNIAIHECCLSYSTTMNILPESSQQHMNIARFLSLSFVWHKHAITNECLHTRVFIGMNVALEDHQEGDYKHWTRDPRTGGLRTQRPEDRGPKDPDF